MRSHVARLLKQPVRARRIFSVSLDNDQAELVEKLSLFFSRKVGHNFSKSQVIEEAVRAFVDDSAEYIAEEYDLDIRETPLTVLQQYKRTCTVDIGALDTVVLPVRDDAASKALLFEQNCSYPVQLDPEKLKNIKYVAFCFGNPTAALTHYARVHSFASTPEASNKQILRFDTPEELGHYLEWRETGTSRLRRPRYTIFGMLMEAKSIEDLFGYN